MLVTVGRATGRGDVLGADDDGLTDVVAVLVLFEDEERLEDLLLPPDDEPPLELKKIVGAISLFRNI